MPFIKLFIALSVAAVFGLETLIIASNAADRFCKLAAVRRRERRTFFT